MRARKQLVVLAAFQRWFIVNFVIYTAVFLAVFGTGLYVWFRVLMSELMNLAGLLSTTFVTLINKHLQLGIMITFCFVVLLLIVAGFQAVYFSRRIAGPLFSLSKHLTKCQREGKLEKWETRKEDLFQDLVTQFNDLVEQLQNPRSKK